MRKNRVWTLIAVVAGGILAAPAAAQVDNDLPNAPEPQAVVASAVETMQGVTRATAVATASVVQNTVDRVGALGENGAPAPVIIEAGDRGRDRVNAIAEWGIGRVSSIQVRAATILRALDAPRGAIAVRQAGDTARASIWGLRERGVARIRAAVAQALR